MAHNVTAPMVGKIVDIKVKVGDQVKEDDEIAVLEAMKMEMPIVAPASGVVKEIKVSVGQTCETDMVLALLNKAQSRKSQVASRHSQTRHRGYGIWELFLGACALRHETCDL